MTKSNMNNGSPVPYKEFSINCGANPNNAIPIILYFASTNLLHRKYNGNIVRLDITMLETLCICMYDIVSLKSKM